MEEHELNIFREKLEEEFNSLLEKGEDIKSFLYLPFDFLTPRIKKYLDDLLISEAYSLLCNESFDAKTFKVYEDCFLSVKLETEQQQIEMLHRMLDHYTEREEYEKCIRIQNVIKQINQ